MDVRFDARVDVSTQTFRVVARVDIRFDARVDVVHRHLGWSLRWMLGLMLRWM